MRGWECNKDASNMLPDKRSVDRVCVKTEKGTLSG
jgi:hypothetical protein